MNAVVRAPAKVTMSLRVLRRREDGYHEIDALAVCVGEPYDTVCVEPSGAPRVTVTGPHAAGVPTDGTDLASRAARLLGRTVSITLDKGIPPGGGLGGGSADAAAVLRALAGPETVREVASDLGSDVPFCVDGTPARMRGRGELLEPVRVPRLHVVIATPRFGCATPDVYRAWDELGGPRSPRSVRAPGFGGELVNDLEPAAEHVEPRLARFRAELEDALGRPAVLCGSGSSFAAWFESAGTAREAAAAARARLDAAGVWATATLPRGHAGRGMSSWW